MVEAERDAVRAEVGGGVVAQELRIAEDVAGADGSGRQYQAASGRMGASSAAIQGGVLAETALAQSEEALPKAQAPRA